MDDDTGAPDSPDDPRATAAPEEMEVPTRPALLTDAEWLEAWAARPVLRGWLHASAVPIVEGEALAQRGSVIAVK